MSVFCRRGGVPWVLLAAMWVVAIAPAGQAQDGDAGERGAGSGAASDLDAMFDAPMVADDDGDDGEGAAADAGPVIIEAPQDQLLTSAGVEWGGRFGFDLGADWVWDDYAGLGALDPPDSSALRNELGATLFFDARPSNSFRVFGKFAIDYGLSDPVAGSYDFDAQVVELFADFQWDDYVFFRAGKQRADWGVGRFFSPADLISLVTIDPLDPEAEREGPVAVKATAPIGLHNLYFYVITDQKTEPWQIGVATRAEIVLGGVELGVGGSYQDELVPKGIVTATGPLGDFDLFGELQFQRGTERNLVELNDSGFLRATAADDRDEWFVSATGGVSHVNTDLDLLLAVQYYFNPLGYDDSAALLQATAALLSEMAVPSPGGGLVDLQPIDLLFFGRHYLGASAIWSDLFDSPLGVQLFWLTNLSDLSGQVLPSVSYRLLDQATVSLGAAFGYGEDTLDEVDEYRESVTLTLALSLGVGPF